MFHLHLKTTRGRNFGPLHSKDLSEELACMYVYVNVLIYHNLKLVRRPQFCDYCFLSSSPLTHLPYEFLGLGSSFWERMHFQLLPIPCRKEQTFIFAIFLARMHAWDLADSGPNFLIENEQRWIPWVRPVKPRVCASPCHEKLVKRSNRPNFLFNQKNFVASQRWKTKPKKKGHGDWHEKAWLCCKGMGDEVAPEELLSTFRCESS